MAAIEERGPEPGRPRLINTLEGAGRLDTDARRPLKVRVNSTTLADARARLPYVNRHVSQALARYAHRAADVPDGEGGTRPKTANLLIMMWRSDVDKAKDRASREGRSVAAVVGEILDHLAYGEEPL